MELPQNRFKQAINQGEKQVGIWISLCSNVAADVVAPAGYDWALIDMEHSPNDFLSVLGQLQVFAGGHTTPLVRVPWNDTVAVKRLLDLGAPGILFPMVQSVQEAEKAVAATRYPPNGVRGFSGNMRGNRFGRVTDYVARIEDELAVLIQLETRSAVENAEDIAGVDGVSGVFFGPADIAADIGVIGQPLAKEVWDLIMPAARKLIARGIPVGTLVMDVAFAAELLNEGFSFVACAADSSLLARAADAQLASVKSALT